MSELQQSMFRQSDNIAELADALSKAQGEMEGAKKDALNPHFRNKYADLESVWEACREPLSKHGLSVLQPVSGGGGRAVCVTTLLTHKSGQWVAADLTLTAQQDTPQAIGSAITYGRRYGLSAMVGIAPEDDDGNAASGGGSKEEAAKVRDQKLAEARAAGSRYAPPPIDDGDIPTALGGSFEPQPPARDRTAEARDRMKPAPVTIPESVDPAITALWKKMSVGKFEALAVFQELKGAFISVCKGKDAGETEYYAIINRYGVEKSDQFKTKGDAKAAVRDMYERLVALKSAQGAA